MSSILSLDSFKKPDDFFWQQKIKLCELESVSFYWADSDESCLNLRQLIESNPEMQKDYERKIDSLNALRLIPVWFKEKSKVVQKNMFDLYHDHILGLHSLESSSKVEVSFLSAFGPYELLNLSELLHPAMYQEFIMVLLLNGKLSRREFRLRFKTRLLLEQDQTVHLINLEQMSPRGVLFSSEKILIEGKVNFFLNPEVLKEAIGMSFDEMKTHLSQRSNNLLYSAHQNSKITIDTYGIKAQTKYDFVKNNLYYYFFNFDRFDNQEIAKNLKDFVNQSKKLIGQKLTKAS